MGTQPVSCVEEGVGDVVGAQDHIAVVLFDADGVIQSSGPFAEYVRSELRWSDGDYRAFLDELFGHPLYEGCLEGRARVLPALAAVLGTRVCPKSPEEFLADWLEIGVQRSEAAFELIGRLRHAGVMCCLATNQDLERAEYMDEVLGYRDLFDRSFYSCRLGARKPDGSYFAAAIESLGCPPAEILFLDDNQLNVAGAAGMGIRAELITPGLDLAALLGSYGLPVG
jgi:putative hydrolase of the HAD superfamily